MAGYATGLLLFGLVVLGWCARWANLKPRIMAFRITSGHAENVASEVQRLLADLKVKPSNFRVSMAGGQSVVEFQAEVGYRQQEQIVDKLNRAGVVTEIIPSEGPRE